MKSIYVITFFLFAVVGFSCEPLVNNSDDIIFNVTREDKTNSDFPGDGFYYYYQFTHYSQDFPNIVDSLNSYMENGVEILDAWFQSGSSVCHPPGSKLAMNVIVEPVLIIRAKLKSDILLTRNYKESDRPRSIFCGYDVFHYAHQRAYLKYPDTL